MHILDYKPDARTNRPFAQLTIDALAIGGTEACRPAVQKLLPEEIGGVRGPEPTRYGDWEHKGRCADF